MFLWGNLPLCDIVAANFGCDFAVAFNFLMHGCDFGVDLFFRSHLAQGVLAQNC